MKKIIRLIFILAFLFVPFQYKQIKANTQPIGFLAPFPNSKYNLPETTITIRYEEKILKSSLSNALFKVSGSISGIHTGKLILSNDQMTVIFKPDQPFSHGELVTVNVLPGITTTLGKRYGSFSYLFSISNTIQNHLDLMSSLKQRFTSENSSNISVTTSDIVFGNSYKTVPLDFPNIHINTPANDVADGYIFASNFIPNAFIGESNPGSYLLMLDNQGEPVYYQKNPETGITTDFKLMENGLLAYWQDGIYNLLDDNYTKVREISPGNGYSIIDLHELILLPNGNYMFLIYDGQRIDMSEIVPGGNPNALVIETVIQEIDSNDNVIFQWNSLDHIPVTDSNRDLTTEVIDYIHANAIELDFDGNLLLSGRHLDEITKIDYQTGEIIWRLGGKANEFIIYTELSNEGDVLFYMQHDVRRLANGNISLFDNHNDHSPLISRILEYSLDEVNKTAELVWLYKNTPELFSGFMGNAQYLHNDNIIIGWGGTSNPNITEIKGDGTKVFELGFDDPYVNYRAYRFPWEGNPSWNPNLTLETDEESISLFFSWNGATDISRYQIYGSNLGQPSFLIGEIPKSGFETSINLVGIQTQFCNYQVMPININGYPTQFSNIVKNPSCKTIYLPTIFHFID